jgi:uncharacterized protein (DUF488 family)
LENNISASIFTLGYKENNNVIDINTFFYALEFYGINSLIDIRANPMPTDYPEFDRGHVHQFCENKEISYHWAGRQLGDFVEGREGSKHEGLLDIKLRAYADYMGTQIFQFAAAQIINMAGRGAVALFSESVQPDNDFRLLLSDYLLLQGLQVKHIISVNEVREHLLHKNARRESVELIYDNIN